MLINGVFFRTLAILASFTAVAAFANNGSESDAENNSVKPSHQCLSAQPQPTNHDNLTKLLSEQPFQLLGQAKFSVLFWDIYESKLLTTDGQRPFSSLCQHSLFEIQYLRDISQRELLENTVSQWQHLAFNETDYRAYVSQLASIWPDIKAGDQLSMLSQQGTTSFYLNMKKIGEIHDASFAKAFLSIWLDENTSEPKLRQQLLGVSI